MISRIRNLNVHSFLRAHEDLFNTGNNIQNHNPFLRIDLVEDFDYQPRERVLIVLSYFEGRVQ